MKVGLVSCSSGKKEGKHKAKDLYDSSLFNKSYRYAKMNFDEVRLLSAKHRLLDPMEEIENYDITLNDMGVEERREWSREVADSLNERYTDEDKLYFLTGKKYYEFVLEDLDIPHEIPMEGLGIGEKLGWLNDKIRVPLFFSSYITYNTFKRQIFSYSAVSKRALSCEVAFIDSGIFKENREIEDIASVQKRYGDVISSVDVMEDVDETVDNTLKWEDMTEGVPKEKKVYVLQGRDERDYMNCLRELEGSVDMEYVGLGGLIKKSDEKVKKLLSLVPELKGFGYDVHVFGIGIRFIPSIKKVSPTSWDTSSPVRDAIDGDIYTFNLKKRNLGKVTPKERGWIAHWNAEKIQDYLDRDFPKEEDQTNISQFC